MENNTSICKGTILDKLIGLESFYIVCQAVYAQYRPTCNEYCVRVNYIKIIEDLDNPNFKEIMDSTTFDRRNNPFERLINDENIKLYKVSNHFYGFNIIYKLDQPLNKIYRYYLLKVSSFRKPCLFWPYPRATVIKYCDQDFDACDFY
jgi:hypothetical protein